MIHGGVEVALLERLHVEHRLHEFDVVLKQESRLVLMRAKTFGPWSLPPQLPTLPPALEEGPTRELDN